MTAGFNFERTEHQFNSQIVAHSNLKPQSATFLKFNRKRQENWFFDMISAFSQYDLLQ